MSTILGGGSGTYGSGLAKKMSDEKPWELTKNPGRGVFIKLDSIEYLATEPLGKGFIKETYTQVIVVDYEDGPEMQEVFFYIVRNSEDLVCKSYTMAVGAPEATQIEVRTYIEHDIADPDFEAKCIKDKEEAGGMDMTPLYDKARMGESELQ